MILATINYGAGTLASSASIFLDRTTPGSGGRLVMAAAPRTGTLATRTVGAAPRAAHLGRRRTIAIQTQRRIGAGPCRGATSERRLWRTAYFPYKARVDGVELPRQTQVRRSGKAAQRALEERASSGAGPRRASAAGGTQRTVPICFSVVAEADGVRLDAVAVFPRVHRKWARIATNVATRAVAGVCRTARKARASWRVPSTTTTLKRPTT